MGFWIRNILFGCILAALAYFFFTNQDLLQSFGETEKASPAVVYVNSAATTSKADEASKKRVPEKDNKAAKSLSNFYANINGTSVVDQPYVRNNIVYLPEPKGDLELLLENRSKTVRPYLKNWQGAKESRPFRKDETIKEKLSEYAKQEKLEVLWRLNRDYVIKDGFRINKTILKTALQLGTGISGHFPNGVSVYFCYTARSIVFIEGSKSYLEEQCSLLRSNSSY